MITVYSRRSDRDQMLIETSPNPIIWENFKRPYLREGSFDPLHVWFYSGVFEVGRSNGAISGLTKSKMATRPPSWKIQMVISPRRIVRFSSCLVLRWGSRVGGSNGTISGFAKSKMAARHLGKFKWRYLRGGSSDLLCVWF